MVHCWICYHILVDFWVFCVGGLIVWCMVKPRVVNVITTPRNYA
jgi:hypothetical protein